MILIDEVKQKEIINQNAKLARAKEYAEIADPLFMKYQRGEVARQDWLDAVEGIRLKYPYA